MNKKQIEDMVTFFLEEIYFEDLLEKFDISPTDAVWALYNQGLIDDEILDSLYTSYED